MSNKIFVLLLVGFIIPLFLVPLLPNTGGPFTTRSEVNSSPYLVYTVKPGDTLAAISLRYDTPVAYLVASNGLTDPALLLTGQTLIIPQGGVLHTVRSRQGLSDIAQSYGVTEGAIRAANPSLGNPEPGEKVFVPRPAVIPQLEAIDLGLAKNLFIWPCRGTISSPFGWRIHPIYHELHLHNGLDLAVPEGTAIHAARAGRVILAGSEGGYGLLVAIDHGDGYSTYYGHLSRILVTEGQFVETGQVVAKSGNTGLSTGPHLHFEVRFLNQPVDPEPLLP